MEHTQATVFTEHRRLAIQICPTYVDAIAQAIADAEMRGWKKAFRVLEDANAIKRNCIRLIQRRPYSVHPEILLKGRREQ